MNEDQEQKEHGLVVSNVVIGDKDGLVRRSSALAKRGIELLSYLPWKSRSLFNGSSYLRSISPFRQACEGRAERVVEFDHKVYEHVIKIANLDGRDPLILSAPAAFPRVQEGKEWGIATDPSCFAWSPSGKYLVTGSYNHETALRLFDVLERRFVECFGRHGDMLVHLAWSGSGEYIASASRDWDPHLKLWRCSQYDGVFGRAINGIEQVGEVVSLEGFPPQELDENAQRSHQLMWALNSSYHSGGYRPRSDLQGFGALAFSPKSNQLAAVVHTRTKNDLVVILDVPTLKEIRRISTDGRVRSLSWMANGQALFFSCNGKLFRTLLHPGNETSDADPVGEGFDLCSCHPFRDVVALARGDFVREDVDLKYVGGLISIRNLRDLSVISEYAAPSGIIDQCWSSDGSQLYAISYDGLGVQYELKAPPK